VNLSTGNIQDPSIEVWLESFRLDSALQTYTAHVLRQLPDAVRIDIMGDGGVVFYDYDPGPGVVMQVPVKIPGPARASRSIVLKRTLRHRSPNFVHWLIAHELAHAHLRNKGRWPGDDPEIAADSLAHLWGFPRPSRW
jgi:hypothetical protein